MRDVSGTVLTNQEVARDTFLLCLECDLPPSVPGQFVMVRVYSGQEPFLRRPFAILRNQDHTLELLYKIKGKGTALLSQKRAGETVAVLGPLGRGFSAPTEHETALYIAGGTGLPPVLSLAEDLGEGIMILGAQTRDDIPLLTRIGMLPGIDLKVTTEDGSFGHKGLATDILDDMVHTARQAVTLYACGPREMLRAVSTYADQNGIRCEVSLEEYMSCGFGVCSGCVVETVHGNLRVCREGPVFDSSHLIWS